MKRNKSTALKSKLKTSCKWAFFSRKLGARQDEINRMNREQSIFGVDLEMWEFACVCVCSAKEKTIDSSKATKVIE